MDLFTVLQALDEHVTPDRCKLHLAVWNGEFDPLDVYLEGGFDDWQSWQRRKNFGLDLVVALIAMSEPDLWLFAGVHDVVRVEHVEGNHPFRAISEFPKGRKYLISLSFRGKASVRPAQVGGFDVNIVIHGSTAVRGRGDLVAYRKAPK